MITSIHNERVKLAKALQEAAKTRRKEGLIVLEGTRLVRDAMRAGYKPSFVFVTPAFRDESVLTLIHAQDVEIIPVDNAVMQHVSDTQQPQGILGIFPMPRIDLTAQGAHLLILDSIRDPGNLGTILRTAAAAGVDAVVLSPTCADPFNPKVLRSGMGAHFRVPVVNMNWQQIESLCADKHVFMADGAGDTSYDTVDWTGMWAIIIGSVAHGAGDSARQLTTTAIRIPMAGETESLNAAVAAGIILFEAMKHHRHHD